jgi:hypothetical protein
VDIFVYAGRAWPARAANRYFLAVRTHVVDHAVLVLNCLLMVVVVLLAAQN